MRPLAGVLAFGLMIGLSSAQVSGSDSKTDAEYAKWAGLWVVRSCIDDGKEVGDKWQGRRLIVRDGKLQWKDGDRIVQHEEKFSLDCNGKTRALTLTYTRGPNKGKTEHCIYQFDNDGLRLCGVIGEAGQRPTDFTCKPGSKRLLFVLMPLLKSAIVKPLTLVHQKQMRLYHVARKVGESDVEAVELWYTRDGIDWKKSLETFEKKPLLYEAPEEGLYGFSVVVRARNGLSSKRPVAGDLPQQWVEVDLTPPTVSFGAFRISRGSNGGKLAINWTASDKALVSHLTTQVRISLAYAEQRDGPWKPVADDLPNTGRYVWNLPKGVPARAFFRIQAVDSSGHRAVALTPAPILLELEVPEGRIIRAEAARPRDSAPEARRSPR
jgi:uncharacterized protein (TIGR03067 family)